MDIGLDRWQLIKHKFIEATECEACARVAAYDKAQAGVDLDAAVAGGDIPALYEIADVQSGMGDMLSAQAPALPQPRRQEQLALVCAFYARSEQTWARIPEPGLFSPSQFPSGDPQRVHERMAACRT